MARWLLMQRLQQGGNMLCSSTTLGREYRQLDLGKLSVIRRDFFHARANSTGSLSPLATVEYGFTNIEVWRALAFVWLPLFTRGHGLALGPRLEPDV